MFRTCRPGPRFLPTLVALALLTPSSHADESSDLAFAMRVLIRCDGRGIDGDIVDLEKKLADPSSWFRERRSSKLAGKWKEKRNSTEYQTLERSVGRGNADALVRDCGNGRPLLAIADTYAQAPGMKRMGDLLRRTFSDKRPTPFQLEEAVKGEISDISRQQSVSNLINQRKSGSLQELREERAHYVTLKFKKSEITLDLDKHVNNELSAREETLLVSESTYNDWTPGKELSSKFDHMGALLKGELASYKIKVKDREIDREYLAVINGETKKIDENVYAAVRSQLDREAASTITSDHAGTRRAILLDKPLSEQKIVSARPMSRHFIKVRVRNTTLSLSLDKHIRNAALQHDLELEVPEQVANNKEAWKPSFGLGAALFKGNLSSLQGDVIDHRSSVDPDYVVLRTESGREFAVHRNRLKELSAPSCLNVAQSLGSGPAGGLNCSNRTVAGQAGSGNVPGSGVNENQRTHRTDPKIGIEGQSDTRGAHSGM